MSDAITVTVELPSILSDKSVQAAAARAVTRAGSDAVRAMRAEGVRYVRSRKALKAGAVRDLIRPEPDPAKMRWSIRVLPTPARVRDYPHRQTKRGVMATINVGSRALIRGAFIATMKSGHRSVWKREGKKRLPIEELWTSSVRQVFRNEDAAPTVLERGAAVFRSAYQRNMTDAMRQRAVSR